MAVVRLIDANAYEYPGDLIHMPTIDAIPVVHGWWELDGGWWRCSACREYDAGFGRPKPQSHPLDAPA